MKGRWVGPFPIVEFLGILPGQGPKDPPRPPSDIFDHILVGESKEKDMYPSLVKHMMFGFCYSADSTLDYRP